MFGLTHIELATLRKLSTPQKIQDYLDLLPINFEKHGDTLYSPRMVLRERKAHCIEAALLAATALWVNGEEPLVLSLHSVPYDCDHIITLFRHRGLWGALSKSNMPVLRYRDPIYKTPRELAMSYFHEYTQPKTGKKTLRSFSKPFNLKKLGEKWITDEEYLWDVAIALYDSPHESIIPKGMSKMLRTPSQFEIVCSDISEWNKEEKLNSIEHLKKK